MFISFHDSEKEIDKNKAKINNNENKIDD